MRILKPILMSIFLLLPFSVYAGHRSMGHFPVGSLIAYHMLTSKEQDSSQCVKHIRTTSTKETLAAIAIVFLIVAAVIMFIYIQLKGTTDDYHYYSTRARYPAMFEELDNHFKHSKEPYIRNKGNNKVII